MRKTAGLIVLAATAACSSAGDDALEAGQWQNSATITAIDLPGAPPAMQEASKAMLDQTQSQQVCMSAAEAALGIENMAKAMQDGDCTTQNFTARDGAFEGKMTCQTGTDARAIIAMTGKYGPARAVLDIQAAVADPSMPGGKANMTMKMEAQRLGDC